MAHDDGPPVEGFADKRPSEQHVDPMIGANPLAAWDQSALRRTSRRISGWPRESRKARRRPNSSSRSTGSSTTRIIRARSTNKPMAFDADETLKIQHYLGFSTFYFYIDAELIEVGARVEAEDRVRALLVDLDDVDTPPQAGPR